MYRITFFFFLFSVITFGQTIQFSDPNLLHYLTNYNCIDTDGDGIYDSTADLNNDGQIQISEAQQALGLTFNIGNFAHNIQDLGGLEHFINLEHLYVKSIDVDHLDLSVWQSLKTLKIFHIMISSFEFDNPLLKHLEVHNIGFNNPLFDLTNLPSIEYVSMNARLTDNLIFGTHNSLEELNLVSGIYTTLNLSGMPSLKYLTIDDFRGTSIDISNATFLEDIFLKYRDNLTTIIGSDASSSLESVELMQNNFQTIPSNLDLEFNNQSIKDIRIRGVNSVSLNNNLTDIGRVEFISINESVELSNSNFNYVDSFSGSIWIDDMISDQISFTNLRGIDNFFIQNVTTNLPLDLSTTEVKSLLIVNCSLTELNLKNGEILESFLSNYDSEIQFICVDDEEFQIVEEGYENGDFPAVIHPYCTFTLGGDYHEVTGDILVDFGSGCTVANGPIFDMQFTVSDGANTDTFYSSNTNNYLYTLPEGNHVLTSELVNLDLWSVSPTSVTLDFPTNPSPYTQDFCITPNVTINDSEIIIIPTNVARPGFEAHYKLIYKNNGTTPLSGSIDLLYNNDVMDFLIASPNINTQSTGSLTWDYIDLLPFETREISFSMQLNTPTDSTFPLVSNDVLNYTTTINPVATDDNPNDNTFDLNQTVVNSFDPNDIRCLEGNSITPVQVGEYVHYLIRFENTGTANAVNVVVKNVINTAEFNISSLVPLHASHNFYTRVKNGNEVEFIFENIQLPFDDANNDGYVLYKIKALPIFGLGDSFSNQAEIYFDFNFPIITNIETTTVEENLSTTKFNMDKISIFPNPSKSILNIKSAVNIDRISILDINGRILSKEQSSSISMEYQIDIKSLSKGIYFLEVQSGAKKQIVKFVKY